MKKFREHLNEAKKLKIGQGYSVHEPGMNEYIDDMEYLGYDRNQKDHIFRAFESPGSNNIYVLYVADKNITREVK